MKSVKHLLKEAREAINAHNYNEAIKLSNSVLRQDDSNYMALIFLGLSYQETGEIEEALKSFRKAVNAKSDNPLCWNGLINYYEKFNNKDTKKDLLEAYLAILKLENDPKKIFEYCEKAAAMFDHGEVKTIFDTVYSCKKKLGEKGSKLNNILVEICKKFKDLPDNIQTIYEECLLEFINSNPKEDYFSSYITLLSSKRRYEELLYYCLKMSNIFPENTTALTTICRTYNQLYIEGLEMADYFHQDACRSSAKLLETDSKNYIAMLTKSISAKKENKILEARDILVEVTNARPGLLHGWALLTEIYTKLYLFDDAQEASTRAYKLNQSFGSGKKAVNDFLDNLAITFLSESSNEKNWQAAIDLYHKIENEDLKKSCIPSLIMAYINLRRIKEAKDLLKECEKDNNNIYKLLLAKCSKKEGNLVEALNILLQNYQENSQWWNEIGIVYWNLLDYKKSYNYFLKSAKTDPNNYLTFMYLGKYYNKISDLEKARRCYEKAFKINQKSQEIAVELSKIYRKLKKYEASQSVLQNLTVHSKNRQNSTAWLQLGLSYLEQGDFSSAIDYLQSAVRIEKTNPVHCWEALADAYLAKGSYTSALKCYTICLELSDQTVYPSLQIANIKKILGEYSEAKADFENLLSEKKNYIPALVGLAETCMLQANDCYKDQRLGKAKTFAQAALDNLSIAVRERKELVCVWKLLGDVVTFLAKMPHKYCSAFVSDPLVESEQNEIRIEREKLYEIATRCYCEATELSKNNSLIWHDLGTSYLNHALATSEGEKRKNLLTNAMIIMRFCVEANPNSWQHWNSMGVVAMLQSPINYALAQHCFIKAVYANHDSAVAWSNLGVLYLLMNDIKLANKAFAQGQRSDPNHINSWMGQAMIAERIGHEEVLDLFRHSTQLGQHQQSGIGYGHWVCKTLLESESNASSYSIQNMYAIPVACDALTWYTEKNPEDACAWNMLGILRERLGLKESTLNAFKNAYDKAPATYRDLARVNYGRSLYKNAKYSEAIDIFQEVQEATFSSGSTLALALFNDKQYEASHSAYEQALHWLTEEQSSQSDLLVALASMQYMFQGVDAAKTLLFQSIQLKPPSPWSLYATLSLALLHQDWNLAQLVLEEMTILKDDHKNLPHYSTLLSCFYILQKQQRKAVIEISKLVHRHPENSSVWLTLSHLLIKIVRHKKPTLSAAKCAQAAMKLGQSTMDVKKVLSSASLAFLLVNDTKSATITAQKAIHTYPNVADGWAVLSAALQKYERTKCSHELIVKLIQTVEQLEPSKYVSDWIKKQYELLKN